MFFFIDRKHRSVVSLLSLTSVCLFMVHQSFLDYLPEDLCACGNCFAEDFDPWYMKLFSQEIEPFLTKKNSVLNMQTLTWWQSLQKEQHPANYSIVVERLFKLFPENPQYTKEASKSCRKCAVVGNSGNLLKSSQGSLIDANDYVIRMNKGPTKGYEDDVGSKTTHRVIYPESAMDMENSTHLVLFPFKILDLQWLISAFSSKNITRTYTAVVSSIKANRDKVMVLNPVFMKYVHEVWLSKNGHYPSTGFLAVVLALHICDEVNVFGFGADSKGNWHHYFEKTPGNYHTGGHGGSVEYETLLKLYLKGKVQLHKKYG